MMYGSARGLYPLGRNGRGWCGDRGERIVAGSPARIIRYRFDHEAIGELLRLQWWNYGLSALDGATIKDIDFALSQIDRNIQSGHAEPYSGPILRIAQDTVDVISADAEAGTLAD